MLDIVDDCAMEEIVIYQKEGILPDEMLLQFDIAEGSRSREVRSVSDENKDIKTNTNYLYEKLEVRLKKQISEADVELSINQSIEVNDIHIDIEKLTITL